MARYQALNPSAWLPDVELYPLAERIPELQGRTVCCIAFRLEDPLLDTFLPMVKDYLETKCGCTCLVKTKLTPSMADDEALWQEITDNADGFVFFGTSMPSQTAHAAQWSAKLERAGTPGVVAIFDLFRQNAAETSKRLGVPIRVVELPHPLDRMDAKASRRAMEQIQSALTHRVSSEETRSGTLSHPRPPRIAIEGTEDEVQAHFYAAGWTDGLPIIIPTTKRLQSMLAGTRHKPDEIITDRFPPEGLQVNVERIAINGIMAGCRPEHLPVLIALAEAFAAGDNEPKVVSTNSFSFMTVVNGPVRKELAMNSGVNALGPGNLANATLGRALRLFIHNLGGGRPGRNIMATQGNVSNYSFCFAENEEHSPWESFHVSQGFRPGESTVTVFNGGWCHVGNFGFEGFDNLARAIAHFEHPEGVVILVSPEKAAMFADQGLNKQDLEEAIWANATTTMKRFKSNSFFTSFVESNLRGVPWEGESYLWPKEYLGKHDDDPVQVFPRKFVRVIVVGGESRDVMQAWRMSRPSTASVDRWR